MIQREKREKVPPLSQLTSKTLRSAMETRSERLQDETPFFSFEKSYFHSEENTVLHFILYFLLMDSF